MSVRILCGHVLDVLKTLPDESIQCTVTSPPYWGLRQYIADGAPEKPYEIGLEPTPEAFVEKMVAVFREVKRVLRSDGTLWLNLGDSYAASAKGSGGTNSKQPTNAGSFYEAKFDLKTCALKTKDLVGIPWMTAFALRADGWYLRQEIIWNKPNPMPESVNDRCTKSHEHIFLMSKSARYFYDADAIAEPHSRNWAKDGRPVAMRANAMDHLGPMSRGGNGQFDRDNSDPKYKPKAKETGANKRSVWTIATQPYSEAHFATFPQELPETCIKAGSRIGDTILDPFGGAGTTALVADKLNRNAVLIELNPQYAAMAEKRIYTSAPLFAEIATSNTEQMSLLESDR